MILTFCFLNFVEKTGDLKIGILKEVPNCQKFVQMGDLFYVNVVARVNDNPDPIVDSYRTGKPFFWKNNNTDHIAGIDRGLRGACEGEIRRLTIPPDLAYGKDSVEGLFPPKSTWIVDCEVLEIVREKQL